MPDQQDYLDQDNAHIVPASDLPTSLNLNTREQNESPAITISSLRSKYHLALFAAFAFSLTTILHGANGIYIRKKTSQCINDAAITINRNSSQNKISSPQILQPCAKIADTSIVHAIVNEIHATIDTPDSDTSPQISKENLK